MTSQQIIEKANNYKLSKKDTKRLFRMFGFHAVYSGQTGEWHTVECYPSGNMVEFLKSTGVSLSMTAEEKQRRQLYKDVYPDNFAAVLKREDVRFKLFEKPRMGLIGLRGVFANLRQHQQAFGRVLREGGVIKIGVDFGKPQNNLCGPCSTLMYLQM